jgi:exosortase/archaeosortase family protein
MSAHNDRVSATHLLLLQALAFWPVWQWYGRRMVDGSDEPFGVLALLSATIIVLARRPFARPSYAVVMVCAGLVSVYLITYQHLPSLIRGVLAALALACLLSAVGYRRTLHPAIAGLLVLSLPLLASLQFFGGFPLRLVTTHLVAMGLSLFGWEVGAQGTLLHWAGEIIAVDAPCAGIKMLWSGLLLNFTLAAWADLDLLKTWLGTSLTLLSVFIGNVLRATALFFTESGLVSAPEFMHQGIGVIVFALVACVVLGLHRRLRSYSSCAV